MILDSLVEHVVHLDHQLRILWANRAACAHSACREKSLLAKPVTRCGMRAGALLGLPSAARHGNGPGPRSREDHTRWKVLVYPGIPCTGQRGNHHRRRRNSLDITERKRAEEALRQSQEIYRILLQTSPDAVAATDPEGQITFVSPRTLELMGYRTQRNSWAGAPLNSSPLEDRKRAMTNLEMTLAQGIVRDSEYQLLRQDGTTFTGELSSALRRDAQGNPQGFIATDPRHHRAQGNGGRGPAAQRVQREALCKT